MREIFPYSSRKKSTALRGAGAASFAVCSITPENGEWELEAGKRTANELAISPPAEKALPAPVPTITPHSSELSHCWKKNSVAVNITGGIMRCDAYLDLTRQGFEHWRVNSIELPWPVEDKPPYCKVFLEPQERLETSI